MFDKEIKLEKVNIFEHNPTIYIYFCLGPPFGGFMYEFFGKTAPFLILACLALGIISKLICSFFKVLANIYHRN